MGLFSDFLSMAVSEVANAVMDGVNESICAQEEQNRLVEEYKETYGNIAYENLQIFLGSDKCTREHKIAIEQIINDRKKFAVQICTETDDVLCEFDDNALLDFYDKIRQNAGAIFPCEYGRKIVRIFQKELMARPIAKRIYADRMEDYFDCIPYEQLEVVILGNDIHYDEVLRCEAQRELDYRNSIIASVESDDIDELDNDEFMQIYALIRENNNDYFGEYRNKILKKCEFEMLSNRKFLINRFLSEYCEEEFETLLNYSDKKLKSILETEDNEGTIDNSMCMGNENYDLCEKLIAKNILMEREGN